MKEVYWRDGLEAVNIYNGEGKWRVTVTLGDMESGGRTFFNEVDAEEFAEKLAEVLSDDASRAECGTSVE